MSPYIRKRPCCYDANLNAFVVDLTQGQHALVSPEDVARVAQHNWCALKISGSYYAMRKEGDRSIYLHRFVLDGEIPDGCDVDHANRDTLDCRRENLRIATRRQNNLNRRGRHNVSSRYKGVTAKGGRWIARVDQKHVGSFASEEEAARAYDAVAAREHGEFACLNFPSEETVGC